MLPGKRPALANLPKILAEAATERKGCVTPLNDIRDHLYWSKGQSMNSYPAIPGS